MGVPRITSRSPICPLTVCSLALFLVLSGCSAGNSHFALPHARELSPARGVRTSVVAHGVSAAGEHWNVAAYRRGSEECVQLTLPGSGSKSNSCGPPQIVNAYLIAPTMDYREESTYLWGVASSSVFRVVADFKHIPDVGVDTVRVNGFALRYFGAATKRADERPRIIAFAADGSQLKETLPGMAGSRLPADR